MTWDAIGKNSRRAAQLLKERHARSCVSRAYYAAFSVLNEKLLRYRRPGNLFETHSHNDLDALIESYLLRGNQRVRRGLRTAVSRLYKRRLAADYKLTRTVDEREALDALRDVKSIFHILEVDDA